MYAIIASGGKQYKVTNGDVVKFEKLEGNAGDKVVFDQVLLVSEKKTIVGDPVVAGAVVNGEIVEQGKDKKVIVYKYKPKSGYHKKNGHRQPITVVKIDNITLNGVELVADKVEKKIADNVAKAEKKIAEAEEKIAEAAEKVEEKIEEVVETVKEAAAEKAAETAEKVEVEIIDAEAAVEEAKEAVAAAEEAAE